MASLVWSIGLICSLNRREELTVPSWPAESINTGMALLFAVATPSNVANKATVTDISTIGSNTNNITCGGDVGAGVMTKADIKAAASVTKERGITNGHI